jgi:hypothetical protein
MNFVLSREHLGKIVRFDELTVVTLPENVFKQGDILVMFNNTDKFTTIESKLAKTYRSAMPKAKSHLEFPPRSLVNVIFVADDIAVFTFGV